MTESRSVGAWGWGESGDRLGRSTRELLGMMKVFYILMVVVHINLSEHLIEHFKHIGLKYDILPLGFPRWCQW